MERVFFYGTLLTGTGDRAIDAMVRRLCRPIGDAFVQGRLYDMGRYPGARSSDAARDRVYGRVYEVLDPARCFAMLDRYEDFDPQHEVRSEFVRRRTRATLLPRHTPLDAWIYFYNRDVRFVPRIKNGRYAPSLARDGTMRYAAAK